MRLVPATTPNHSLGLDHDRDLKDFDEASQKHLDSVVATGASYKTDRSPILVSRNVLRQPVVALPPVASAASPQQPARCLLNCADSLLLISAGSITRERNLPLTTAVMRLFLLPLTNNRTLLYCQRIPAATTEKQGIVDKVTNKAAKLWSTWEKKDNGWQRKVVDYGNHALRRIPYEEWGLKSVPPLSARKKEMEVKGNTTVQLHYPQSIIPTSKAESLIMRLATERDALHRKRLIWSIVGMPLSAPFALIPVIPNLPFFYLVYRAWSHWRALAGGDHLEFLAKNKLLALSPSKILDDIYNPLLPSDPAKRVLTPPAQTGPLEKEPELSPDETILLTQENGRQIAEALGLPELEVEMERAIWQINRAKQKINEKQEKGATPSTCQKEDNTDTKEKP